MCNNCELLEEKVFKSLPELAKYIGSRRWRMIETVNRGISTKVCDEAAYSFSVCDGLVDFTNNKGSSYSVVDSKNLSVIGPFLNIKEGRVTTEGLFRESSYFYGGFVFKEV